jgi:hypothetical protein
MLTGNEVLKCEVFMKGIAEGEGLVIRCSADKCINTPTIQISDESVALSASDYHRIDEAGVYAH